MALERTLIVIPALNEQRRIGELLSGIRRAAPGVSLLVVDDGSRDATASIAAAAGARVVSHPFNLGYGAALSSGYRYALRAGFGRVIQMDADGQHDPESLARIGERLDDGVDLVLGSRFLHAESYRPPLARRIGILLFSGLVSLALGRRISDATTGFQGLSASLLGFYTQQGSFPADYPDANILIRCGRAGFRIEEVPVRMRANPDGGTLHVGLKPLVYILRMLFAVAIESTRRLPRGVS
ncbi:MAG: glycosyltransferase [Candidatus Eisenbacteria bacterium]|nr:glycosyltransferase [Candidatus Eisenbacteria bacterium]